MMGFVIDAQDRESMARFLPDHRLRGGKILITGGSGFVGRWMRAARPNDPPCWLSSLTYQTADWQEMKWDYIVHLAPVPPHPVIACAEKCGARVLYASSGAVYDDPPGEYAQRKIGGEAVCLESSVPVVIARLYSFIGPGCYHAPAQMILSAKLNQQICYRPDTYRSWLYAADMAVWLWKALIDGEDHTIYEVGDPTPVSMAKLAYCIHDHLPDPDRVEVIEQIPPVPDPRPYYVPRRAYETALELDLHRTVDLDEAVQKTVDSYYPVEEE